MRTCICAWRRDDEANEEKNRENGKMDHGSGIMIMIMDREAAPPGPSLS